MTLRLLKGFILSATIACGNAYAAFDGDYDISNWTSTVGSGSIDTSNGPLNVTLIGGNNNSNTASTTSFRVAITTTGTLSFDWAYASNEANSFWDPFGYELDGAITQLTTNGAAAGSNQSGSVSIAVTVGQIFGFRQTTRDNLFGSASTTISNFAAPGTITPSPVPIPPSFGLFGFALGGMVMMHRRDKRNK